MPSKKETNQPITQAQEEEMSSALIAKLLAEDAMAGGHDYYAEYSNDTRGYDEYHAKEDQDDSYEDESEDDYTTSKRSAKNKGRSKSSKAQPSSGKRGRKRKTDDAATNTGEVAAEDSKGNPSEPGMTATETPNTAAAAPAGPSTSKKPRKPVPEGMNTGVYSEEEERRFLEGLELYGRDWTKLMAHIATRDGNSVRSHAQKHFIKLYRDNIPLPAKVRESGEGYTLSGKPLDPNSAAAKPYLSRGSTSTDKPKESQVEPMDVDPPANSCADLAVGDSQQTDSSVSGQQSLTNPAAVQAASSAGLASQTSNPVGSPDAKPMATSVAVEPHQRETSPNTKSKSSKSRSTATVSHKGPIPVSVYDESGRTNYSKSRLRRPRERKSVNYNQLGKDDDPLTMVKCEPFTGKPASNVHGCQPFEIQVHSNVLLAMDFHAHLMTTEIIGFLAGHWNNAEKKLCIKEAFPCRSLNTGQNDVNVEMDPTSAIETRQIIEDKQMMVVGWYHSHPTFVPDPSIIDIENQRNYQVLCREKCVHDGIEETVEPFVGAIVAPYDPRLPGSASVINWFYVGNSREERGMPKRLIYELHDDELLSEEYANRLLSLLEEYRESPEKVDFNDLWRQDISESKLQKLIKSLGSRMPWVQKKLATEDTNDLDSFLDTIQSKLKGW